MSKFSVDYQKLSNSIDKTFYKLSEVKHKLEKVAFDVFRMKDGNSEELWQIQNSDDGDYIVAKYELDDIKNVEVKAANSSWDILISNSSGDINIFYKGHPITKVAGAQFGINVEDLSLVKKYLPNKLSSDKNLVKALFATLDKNVKENLLNLYPELL